MKTDSWLIGEKIILSYCSCSLGFQWESIPVFNSSCSNVMLNCNRVTQLRPGQLFHEELESLLWSNYRASNKTLKIDIKQPWMHLSKRYIAYAYAQDILPLIMERKINSLASFTCNKLHHWKTLRHIENITSTNFYWRICIESTSLHNSAQPRVCQVRWCDVMMCPSDLTARLGNPSDLFQP